MAALESDRLGEVTVSDDEAYSVLVAHCLPVLRVEVAQPLGRITVIWRNPPTTLQRETATRLLSGVAASHAW